MIVNDSIFVDGEWRPSASSDRFTVVDPHTEEPFGQAVIGNEHDVDIAVRSARAALSGPWADTSLADRIAVVERIRQLLSVREQELAELQAHCMGTPFHLARNVLGALDLIDMYIESVRQVNFAYLRSDRHGNSLVTRKPVGVVAGIVPWNAPVRSEIKKAIPAILAGCTVVLKPAPETPFGAGILAEICHEAGLPDGVINLVPGDGRTGEALISHPEVRKIAFTGSSAAGSRIASIAGQAFKRLQLELGGKSAAVLLDDADLATAIPTVVTGAWLNTGQACTALTRVLAPRRRYDEIVEALVEQARRQVVGDPMDPNTTLGPLVAERQRRKVFGYIDTGLAEGARIAIGGGRPDHPKRGWYVEPTVFTHVRNDMTIAQDEIFGPVTCVIPYATVDEAVEIANDTRYGLHGAVFSADAERAFDVAQRLDTGSVGVNKFALPSSAPFGGVKASGIGREHGPEGYDSFLEYIGYNLTPEQAHALSSRYPSSR